MAENVISNSRIYTNVQGLTQLRYEYKKNPDEVKKEVAKQFEALLMQMLMHSMRDANKAFGSDLFGSNQMDFYQDMFDKQLSMIGSNSNLGIAKMFEENIDRLSGKVPGAPAASGDTYAVHGGVASSGAASSPVSATAPQAAEQNNLASSQLAQQQATFASPEDFVKKLWSMAKVAASALGANPEILLAQTALETNWGKNVISQGQNASSHNLFNIKAGSNWSDKTVAANTLEQKNGVLVKEKSNFRSYDSFESSFVDYVTFLKQNGRYNDALKKADDPKQFVQALQDAGFATDQNYADKVLKIFSSPSFQNMVAKAKQETA